MAERKLVDVIHRILALVPPSAARGENIRVRLTSLKDNVPFTAPEAMGRQWRRLSNILTQELRTTAEEPWEAKIGRIVRGEE